MVFGDGFSKAFFILKHHPLPFPIWAILLSNTEQWRCFAANCILWLWVAVQELRQKATFPNPLTWVLFLVHFNKVENYIQIYLFVCKRKRPNAPTLSVKQNPWKIRSLPFVDYKGGRGDWVKIGAAETCSKCHVIILGAFKNWRKVYK